MSKGSTTDIKGKVRVRMAPSPTGKFQMGNLRTSIYDYLFAKKYNGEFILRIEDTDQKRKVEGGVEAIIEVCNAYGIDFAEDPVKGGEYGPYEQSARLDIYNKYAKKLVEKGGAYYCFCTQERIDQLRASQEASKQKPMYDRLCRTIPNEEAEARIKKGEPYVIRMKFPIEGDTVFEDVVYGKVRIKNELVDDQVLIKTDKFPTYHFGVVVDDHLMKISHIIRGREYLADTPKNTFLFESFGWKVPAFVHVPHVLNPDGAGKLSKRKGALSAISYLRRGYLVEAVFNYLALVGWAPAPEDAHQDEIYTIEDLVQKFSLDRLHKAGGRYDQQKFDYINGKHIRLLSTEQLADRIIEWAERYVLKEFITDKYDELADWEIELKNEVARLLPLWKANKDYFIDTLELVHERLVYLAETPELLRFFYAERLDWTDEDWNTKNQDKKALAKALEGVMPKLEAAFDGGKSFEHDAWEQAVRGYADELGWKHGDLFMAIRSAVTGKLNSPPLLEVIEVMGWEKAKGFIEGAVVWLRG